MRSASSSTRVHLSFAAPLPCCLLWVLGRMPTPVDPLITETSPLID
ncbi:mCG1030447 [Mus musculus]|nr:mCG1030447 [Mus musculus]